MMLRERNQHALHAEDKWRGHLRKRLMVYDTHNTLPSIDWPHDPSVGIGYDYEDELCDQLDRLPDPEYVDELLSRLRVATIRELSKGVVNGGVEYVKGDCEKLEYMKLLNSWLATAEETIAAGRNVNRIAARRKAFVKGTNQD
jgi:hypothetical protein